MRFSNYNISPDIKNNLELMGFIKPTDIQYKSIPAILKGEDVMAIAQTGTGKTAAFAIPIISIIHEQKNSRRSEGVRCVVMVPTRELAIQINEVFTQLCRHTKVIVFALVGGVEQDPQIAKLESGIDVLIATPGRMFDLVSQGHLDLSQVDMLVLDEADRMLDLGFIKDIRDIIKHISRRHQTLFFSATINEEIKDLAYSLVKNPIRIQISPKDKVSKNIDHSVAFIEMDDKRFFLERLIKENEASKILVFVRTKVRAERVLSALSRVEIEAVTIHGDKDQKTRNQAMDGFRTGEKKILIATDVSARGIDIPDVEFVVNYDLPDVPENYVHRVGRTGRGTKKGKAVSFCSTEEKPVLKEIEDFLTVPVKILDIDFKDYSATIDFSEQVEQDWRTLMKEAQQQEEFMNSKKKKFKKK